MGYSLSISKRETDPRGYTMKRYTVSTHDAVVGTVATWDEAVELARGYWGMTPRITAAEAASVYAITVYGDYVGTLTVAVEATR